MPYQPPVSRGRTARLLVIALLLAMPCVALLFLATPTLQAGSLDPYFYTALIHDYSLVLEHYGATYYANRVAFTIPARLAVAWLGDAGGHFAFQWAYLTAATISGFALARRYYSARVGIAAAAWTAFNPWLIRALAWDYVEGAAICYMLAAFSCFVCGRRPLLLHLLGGGLYAFACNASPFACAIALAFAPAWLILNAERGLWPCVRLAAIAIVGFLAGYFSLMGAEYLEAPALGFWRELVTLNVGMQLLEGGASVWFRPLDQILEDGRLYVLMPPLVALAVVVLIASNRVARFPLDRFPVAAASFALSTCAAYGIFHYVVHAAVLTTIWYDGYAFPGTLFGFVALFGQAHQGLSGRARQLFGASAALGFALLWVGYDELRFALPLLSPTLLAVTTGLLILSIVPAKRPGLRAIGVAASAMLAIIVFYYPPYTSRTLSPAELKTALLKGNQYSPLHDPMRQVNETDMYKAALFLQRVVGETLPVAEGSVGFWYGSRPDDAPFASIQSMFFYGYSMVVSPALPNEAGTRLDDDLRSRLAKYSHIVILSRTEQEANASLDALRADGAQAPLRAHFTFLGAWFGYQVTIVDYIPPAPAMGELIADVPLTALVAANGGLITTSSDGVSIKTSGQWAYSAVAPLAAADLPAREVVLRVKLRVVRGEVGIGIAGRDNLFKEASAGASAIFRTVDVPVARGDLAQSVIIRNWSPTGQSIVNISDIAIFRKKPQVP